MSGWPTADHEGWEGYLRVEREQLCQRAEGKMARMLGRAQKDLGETQEKIDRIAEEDRQRALAGLVELRRGERVWYEHIDNLTRELRPARLEAERAQLVWLKQRLSYTPPLLVTIVTLISRYLVGIPSENDPSHT